MTYDVGSTPDAVSFIVRFDRDTVPVGYPKAHLWVEARGADDMDLFVLLPIGLAFRAGEQLRLVVSSRDILGTLMPGIREYTGADKGPHVIHTGGERAAHLRLPVLAAHRRW